MKKQKNKTNSEEELISLGISFGKQLKKGQIVFLNGQLGAGKTTFVKGVAKGLGIDKIITSPTFLVIKEYDNILCHVDAYKISKDDIGIDHYLEQGYIICIEWAENIASEIAPNYVVSISYNEDGRKIEIEEYARS